MSGGKSERARFIIATTEIGGSRLFYGGTYDVKIAQRHGYSDMDAYWHYALSEPMSAKIFLDLLETHHRDPAAIAEETAGRTFSADVPIWSALRLAIKAREPWIWRDPLAADDALKDVPTALIVDPQRAVEWLRSKPMRRDLLPGTLLSFLERDAQTGPKPGQLSAKARAEDIALAILGDPQKRPGPGHGRLIALARLVLEELRLHGIQYSEEWGRKILRPALRAWEKTHPKR